MQLGLQNLGMTLLHMIPTLYLFQILRMGNYWFSNQDFKRCLLKIVKMGT